MDRLSISVPVSGVGAAGAAVEPTTVINAERCHERLVKEGKLTKKSSSQSVLKIALGTQFTERTVRLFVNGLVQYFAVESDRLRGQFDITKASVQRLSPDVANGKEHAFVIKTLAHGDVVFSSESGAETDSWIAAISYIASGKAKTLELGDVLGISLPQIIDIECETSDLLNCLSSSSIDGSRFQSVFYESFIDGLIANCRNFEAQDPGVFAEMVRERFSRRKIIMRPFAANAEPDKFHRCTFTPTGELVLQFRRTAVTSEMHLIGIDIPNVLSDQPVSYFADRSIRKFVGERDKHLAAIGEMLHTSDDVVFDDCVVENLHAVRAANFTDDRFGDIFYIAYLQIIESRLKGCCEAYPTFAAQFVERFTSNKIVMRPAEDPSTLRSGYDASFTATGDFLIEYKKIYSDLHELGNDFVDALSR